MPLTLLAVLAAAASASVAVTPRSTRRPFAPGGSTWWRSSVPGSRGTLLAATGLGVGAAAIVGSWVPLVVSPVSVLVIRRLAADRATRRRAAVRRAAAEDLCCALGAELRAGRPASEALRRAAADLDSFPNLAATAATGGDIVAGLTAGAREPGAESLIRLAACWRVAEGAGAGLASAVDRVAAGLRAEEAHRRTVESELAGPRATARLLSALPAFGLVLGSGLGAHPLEVLLHTSYGGACLVLGLLLDAAGLLWTGRLAAAAERAA